MNFRDRFNKVNREEKERERQLEAARADYEKRRQAAFRLTHLHL